MNGQLPEKNGQLPEKRRSIADCERFITVRCVQYAADLRMNDSSAGGLTFRF